jgi:pyridoxamine 5'-phosphate oxidase
VRSAVLSTVDEHGRPRARWMIPCVLPGYDGSIYCITSPHFSKVHDLERHPDAEWMVQTLSLNQVINLAGRINLIDNPSLKARIMEVIGQRLHAYWKLSTEESDFLVLETVVKTATYYLPMKGSKETVRFDTEDG